MLPESFAFCVTYAEAKIEFRGVGYHPEQGGNERIEA
jgi:hypothetical protein